MEKYYGNTVEYWKQNAEKDYSTTPISVLKYITVLEEQVEQLRKQAIVAQNEQLKCGNSNPPCSPNIKFGYLECTECNWSE